MRRIFAFFLCLLLLAGALPAALAMPESVDYDVLVTPEDNIGLNMREGPSSVYARVRPGPCPAAGPGRGRDDGAVPLLHPLPGGGGRRGL